MDDSNFRHLWLIGQESKDLINHLYFQYPKVEGQIQCYERGFVVSEAVAYP